MSSSAIWLSYDLGLRGDYASLYAWLDSQGAQECGDSIAFFTYEHQGDLKESLKVDLANAIAVDKNTRVYLVFRDVKTKKIKGSFLFGRRRAAPWTGYSTQGAAVVEDEEP